MERRRRRTPGAAALGALIAILAVGWGAETGAGADALGDDRLILFDLQLSGRLGDSFYALNAAEARQGRKRRDIVTLSSVSARLSSRQNDRWIALNARNGRHDRKKKLLTLEGGVTLRTHDGHVGEADNLHIRTADGSVWSDSDIAFTAAGLRFKTRRLDIIDGAFAFPSSSASSPAD